VKKVCNNLETSIKSKKIDWNTDWLKKRIERLRSKPSYKKSLSKESRMNSNNMKKTSRFSKKNSEKMIEDINNIRTRLNMRMLLWHRKSIHSKPMLKKRKIDCQRSKT